MEKSPEQFKQKEKEDLMFYRYTLDGGEFKEIKKALEEAFSQIQKRWEKSGEKIEEEIYRIFSLEGKTILEINQNSIGRELWYRFLDLKENLGVKYSPGHFSPQEVRERAEKIKQKVKFIPRSNISITFDTTIEEISSEKEEDFFREYVEENGTNDLIISNPIRTVVLNKDDRGFYKVIYKKY